MPDIPLDKASLVALWVETLLYGAYAVLFSICIYILLYSRKPSSGLNKPLLTTAVAMFAMSTIHVAVGLARGIAAFIDSKDLQDGAISYFAEIWIWISIFKQALYVTNNVIADALVVYRCYVVWSFSVKIIVIPIILLISTTVCGYLAVFNFSQVHPGDSVFAPNIAEWGTALFSLSLATNITVTSLIAARIWWISREAQAVLGRKHSQKYSNAVAIILESGAIYSVSLMTLLILYCTKSNAQYIAYDALAQIMGIVPTLIIVRVGLGVSTQDVHTYGNQTSTKVVSSFRTGQSTPMPMQVRKVIQVDNDSDDLEDTERGRKVDFTFESHGSTENV
ncbi:hypothetical protein BD779DRAFT_1517608 [Infundibulicybe gibba]|nr:hypothetical protein BD779DRAFT_1517608 [Infundibulicybe gibba]